VRAGAALSVAAKSHASLRAKGDGWIVSHVEKVGTAQVGIPLELTRVDRRRSPPRSSIATNPRRPGSSARMRAESYRRRAPRRDCSPKTRSASRIEHPGRSPSGRTKRRRRERDGEGDADQPGCDHGSQLNSSHSPGACSAESIVGSIVLSTSSAALVTARRQVMQPAVPRRERSIITVARRFAACGADSLWIMLDLHLSATHGIVPCRAFIA
jgi:hypothetical protein